MTTNQREVEIRFKLTPDQRGKILAELKKKGWAPLAVHQSDVYYCHQSFIDAGNEKECPYIVRIRKSDEQAKLAYKSFTGDGSWVEHETGIENPSEASRYRQHFSMENKHLLSSEEQDRPPHPWRGAP